LLPLLVIPPRQAATASHPTPPADHHSRDYGASVQSTPEVTRAPDQCQSSNRIPEVVFFNTCFI